MARPIKQGLDYFPLDVLLDDKFKIIEAVHGMVGFAVIIKLYQKIYSVGYFYNWEEMEQILFCNSISTDRNKVTTIISDCLKWGIFSKEMYEKYKILTSRGIQSRFVTSVSKRVNVEMIKEYLLIDISGVRNITCISISTSGNHKTSIVSVVRSTQSKVKESKGKNNTDFFNSKKDNIQKEKQGKITSSQGNISKALAQLKNIGHDD